MEKSSRAGHVEAQYNLGNAYHNGKGVEKFYEKAVYWYTKAAEQGHVEAQLYLGTAYYYKKV